MVHGAMRLGLPQVLQVGTVRYCRADLSVPLELSARCIRSVVSGTSACDREDIVQQQRRSCLATQKRRQRPNHVTDRRHERLRSTSEAPPHAESDPAGRDVQLPQVPCRPGTVQQMSDRGLLVDEEHIAGSWRRRFADRSVSLLGSFSLSAEATSTDLDRTALGVTAIQSYQPAFTARPYQLDGFVSSRFNYRPPVRQDGTRRPG